MDKGAAFLMNVNYEYYRIFYYAAKFRSFTKAASLLGSNQPNVTRAMNRLEHALGCTLFVRSNKGIVLTPEGEALFRHVEIAQEQLQKGEEELSASAALTNGSISISASETALNILLSEKLEQFHLQYPGIRLRLSNHSTTQAIDALERGLTDLAVVTAPAHTKPHIRETPLHFFRDILVGGKSFSAMAGQTLHIRDLARYPLIFLGRETMTYSFYSQLFLQYGQPLQPDTEVSTADQLLLLVKCNLGLAFVPEAFVQDALAQGEVFQIFLAEPLPQRHISLLRDSRRPLSVAAREFVHTLKGEAPAGTPD